MIISITDFVQKHEIEIFHRHFKTGFVVLDQALSTQLFFKGNTVRDGFSKWSKSNFCANGHWWEWDFLGHSQRLSEEKLLKCYTDEVASEICKLELQNCNGCRIDHPSQRQHDCRLMKAEEKMWVYFDCAFGAVSEATIVEVFMNSLQDIKPLVNGLELLKYTCQDWRTLFCVKNRELLKRRTLAILY